MDTVGVDNKISTPAIGLSAEIEREIEGIIITTIEIIGPTIGIDPDIYRYDDRRTNYQSNER